MPRQAERAPLPVLPESERKRVYGISSDQLATLGTPQLIFDLLRATDTILRFDTNAQDRIPVHEWNITVRYFTTPDSRHVIMKQIGAKYPQRVTQITGQILTRARSFLPAEEQAKYDVAVLLKGKYNLANAQAQERRFARSPILRRARWRKSAEDAGRRRASSRALHLLRQDETFNTKVMAAITAPETRAAAEATKRAKYFDQAAAMNIAMPLYFARRGDRIVWQREQTTIAELKIAMQTILNTALGPVNSMDLSHQLAQMGVRNITKVHILAALYDLRKEHAVSVVQGKEIQWIGFIPTVTAHLESQTRLTGSFFPSEAMPVERILEKGRIAVNVASIAKTEPDAIRLGVCVYEETAELDETGQRKRSSILNIYTNGTISLSAFNGRTYTQVFKGLPSALSEEERNQAIAILRTAQETVGI